MLNSRLAFLTQLNGFDPSSLGLLQRIFLVNDGTLTDALEAAMLEPIRVAKLAVDVFAAADAVPELELETGSLVMDRKILLFGENTRRNYVYAESRVAVERLPEPMRHELMNSEKPMGRLWSEYRLETWKELLRVSRGPNNALAAYFPGGASEDLVSRRYRLLSGGKTLMVIDEHFPAKYS